MQSNFDNRDFEQFVKQNADQYRMFPSEKVWTGIHSALHTRLRRLGYGLTLLLLSSAAITWIMLSNTRKANSVQAEPVSKNQLKNYIALHNEPGTTVQSPVIFTGTTERQTSTQPFVSEQTQNLVTIVPAEELNQDEAVEPFVNANTAGQEKTIVQHTEISNPIPATISINDQANKFNYQPIDNIYPAEQKLVEQGLTNKNEIRQDVYPMGIESIVNSFSQQTPRARRLNFQLYFTPTISYRKLTENKAYLNSVQGSSSQLYDVNSVVTHKPDMGLELGFNASYHLTPNFNIIAGFQFNVSKYDIRAYDYSTEVATIALNVGYGTSSVSTATNYRNFDGYKQNWLANLYYSVSMPIGAELKLTGDRKTYWGVGGTVQPTYILGDRAYLISTDYKNYAEVPSLMRRWNVSSSIETFAGYSTGKINWRIGPQVRYQMLSSFKEKYPVKEHLFDFGLKVGIMLNQ
ncbi:MAG TPA: hypothetical protein VLJ68_06495 [Chitinophagaceae bacterium]|nr:hypothetical protein [Chitinophagaceae bacterium]